MNKILNITDVFFDLDHTLWDFDKNSGLAFKRVFKKHQIAIKIHDFLKVYEPINLEYWRLFRNEKVSKQKLRRGRLIDTFAKLNVTFPLADIDAMANSYIDELPVDNHLFEGTHEILSYLSNKYKLHIITNGFEEVQQKKLVNSDIKKYFKTTTTSEEAGVKKPNPLIFNLALKKAKTTASKSIMIGDSLEADILGAKEIGMNFLHFNEKNNTFVDEIDRIVKLEEICHYL
jgi:putative hydrolase of the HAD superfamily